jgi:hypothetical protein
MLCSPREQLSNNKRRRNERSSELKQLEDDKSELGDGELTVRQLVHRGSVRGTD